MSCGPTTVQKWKKSLLIITVTLMNVIHNKMWMPQSMAQIDVCSIGSVCFAASVLQCHYAKSNMGGGEKAERLGHRI